MTPENHKFIKRKKNHPLKQKKNEILRSRPTTSTREKYIEEDLRTIEKAQEILFQA